MTQSSRTYLRRENKPATCKRKILHGFRKVQAVVEDSPEAGYGGMVLY